MTIGERIETARRERRVLTRVSRAGWRLGQANGNGRGRWSRPAPRGSRSAPGHGGRAVALPGAPARSGAGLDALDAALGELRAAGWPAPEDPGSDEDAELDGRDSVAGRLSDEVDWLRQCADWLAHLDADSDPPAVSLRPSADWPDRAIAALGSAVAALVVMCAAVRVQPWSMLGILVALPAAVIPGWHVVTRRWLARVVAGLIGLVAVVAPVLHMLAHWPGALLVAMVLFGFSMASVRFELRPAGQRPPRGVRRRGAQVSGAGRVVLLLNPRSGSGKAARLDLAALARQSGAGVLPMRLGMTWVSWKAEVPGELPGASRCPSP